MGTTMPIGRHGRQTDPGVANSTGFGVVAAMNNTSILSQCLNPSRAALTSTKHFALHLSGACGRAGVLWPSCADIAFH